MYLWCSQQGFTAVHTPRRIPPNAPDLSVSCVCDGRLTPAMMQLFCLCSRSVSRLNSQVKRQHVKCHASVLTGSRATDACVLPSRLLVGCAQCEQHRAGRSVEDAALNSSSFFVEVAYAVETFERTHSKNTSHTPHVLCQAKREGTNALPPFSWCFEV